jgi:hypothetical protein
MKNIILSSKINYFLYLKKQKSHYTVVIHNTMSLAYSKTLMESGFFFNFNNNNNNFHNPILVFPNFLIFYVKIFFSLNGKK